MKGLLYKDLKILTTSFRTLPLIVFIFLLVSVFNETGSFWSMYGIFMGCTMISTLQNLDESSKWCTFCDTLPLNRSDLVTEKYILAMIVTALSVAVLVVMRIGFGLFGIGNGFNDLGVTCISMVMAGIVSSSITLMTAFLFGPQKSQIAHLAKMHLDSHEFAFHINVLNASSYAQAAQFFQPAGSHLRTEAGKINL